MYVSFARSGGDIKGHFLGFGGELYLDKSEIKSYDPALIDKIKKYSNDTGVRLTLHAPVGSFNYEDEKAAKTELMPIFEDALKFCQSFEISEIVTHPEFNFKIERPVSDQLRAAKKLWRSLCEPFLSRKIKINLENHYEETPFPIIKLINAIDSSRVKACLDIAHVNAFSELSAEEWISAYPSGYLEEVHLSDNNADRDSHMVIGEGGVDMSAAFNILHKRKEDPFFVLEPLTSQDAVRSVDFLRKEGFLE